MTKNNSNGIFYNYSKLDKKEYYVLVQLLSQNKKLSLPLDEMLEFLQDTMYNRSYQKLDKLDLKTCGCLFYPSDLTVCS